MIFCGTYDSVPCHSCILFFFCACLYLYCTIFNPAFGCHTPIKRMYVCHGIFRKCHKVLQCYGISGRLWNDAEFGLIYIMHMSHACSHVLRNINCMLSIKKIYWHKKRKICNITHLAFLIDFEGHINNRPKDQLHKNIHFRVSRCTASSCIKFQYFFLLASV